MAFLLCGFLGAASAPSPLYAIYQAQWGFSPVTLTAIYAVYAVGALAALLFGGRLPDHVGRRRVTAAGIAIQLVALLAFIGAQGVEWLFLARTLQGIGTGIATGAISAWLLDLQPANSRLGSLVGGVALVAGLGVGALVTALLVDFGPDPLRLVYWLLFAAFAMALTAAPLLPDDAPRAAGWQRSIRPEIGVPQPARAAFSIALPSLVAMWAVAGFYLSLGPSLASSLAGGASRLPGGAVIAALFVTAAAASAVSRAADPRRALSLGSVLLAAGVGVALAGVAAGSLAGLLAGSAVSGLGLGPAFAGVLRSLAPLAPAGGRAALLAAIYIVVYLAFSVPAIVAGLAVTAVGLRYTTYGYGMVVIALAALTAVALWRR